MKDNFLIKCIVVSVLCIGFFSCDTMSSNQGSSAEDSLKVINDSLEESVNSMLSTFNEIQSNLSQIKEKQGYIEYIDSGEGDENLEQKILNDIEIINSLMQQNEEKVKELERQLNKSKFKSKEFRELVSNLNLQLEQKNNEIARLNQLLEEKNLAIAKLYFSVDSLKYASRLKDRRIQSKIDELNVGYFAIGSFKELKERNVLSKEGGLLGIGRSEKLNDNFNKEYFTKIDILEQDAFLILSKTAKIVTTHPSSSYEFHGTEKQVDSLVIIKPKEFWKASKYLVIQTD